MESTPASHSQQHPISLYLKVWGALFVLSTLSYLVDYFGLHDFNNNLPKVGRVPRAPEGSVPDPGPS